MNTLFTQQSKNNFNSYKTVLLTFLIVFNGMYSNIIKGQTPVKIVVDEAPQQYSISVEGEEDWNKFQTLEAGDYSIQTSSRFYQTEILKKLLKKEI